MSEFLGLVNDISIYPVKSAQAATVNGQAPIELSVGLNGFEVMGISDRQFMVCETSGLFVSQRGWNEDKSVVHVNDRRLATLKTDIRADHVAITAPGLGTHEISTQFTSYDSILATVHGKDFWGRCESYETDVFMSMFLGREVQVVRVDPEKVRQLPEKYQHPSAVNRVAAADGMPFLLTNFTSLAKLHNLAGLPRGTVDMNRFRGNIAFSCIESLENGAFIEDFIASYYIGASFIAYAVSACARCPIPSVNQLTGEFDRLANKIIIPHRLGYKPGLEDAKATPFFGVNLNHALTSIGATVCVGDRVHATTRLDSPLFINKQ